MTQPTYQDLYGESHPTTWKAIFDAIKRIDAYFKAVGLRFMERDLVIRLIMCAFLLREHVVIPGPTGAAKSLLINTIYNGIEGAIIWTMDLTRFTNDTHILGAYDTVVMREKGQLVHRGEGTIQEAHFSMTDEFSDASDATLRTFLGIFNEGQIRRGPQVIDFHLITNISCTNFGPEDIPGRSHQLRAVWDRFLFHIGVDYVQDPRNRLMMLNVALNGDGITLPPLHLDDIVLVSGVIKDMNLIEDRYVVEAYQQMTFEYSAWLKKETGHALSDRRFIAAAQIMEVSALLHGRQTVTFEDLEMTVDILAKTDEQREALNTMRREAIATWNEKAQRREIDKELHDLAAITKNMPSVDMSHLSQAELDRAVSDLEAVQKKLAAFAPQSIDAGARHLEATRELHKLSTTADMRRLDIVIESIPVWRDDIQDTELVAMKRQAGSLLDQVSRIKPRGDVAIIKHSEALGRIHQLNIDIEIRFAELGRHVDMSPTETKKTPKGG